jgi:sugar (pentulose or hexulose) kinase
MLWLQIISDVTGCSISLPEETEGSPFGSALIAAVASGLYKDLEEAVKLAVKVNYGIIQPSKENNKLYQDLFGIYQNLYPQLRDTFSKLAEIREEYY